MSNQPRPTPSPPKPLRIVIPSAARNLLFPLPPPVMLSGAKHLIPSPTPNPLPCSPHKPPKRQLLSPLALSKFEGPTHASQTGTPPGSTSAIAATSPQTVNSFRINTYTTAHNCWALLTSSLSETMPQAVDVVGKTEQEGLADLGSQAASGCARGEFAF